MKRQPAEKSYFFDKGYRDVIGLMRRTWSNTLKPVTNEWRRVQGIFEDNKIAGIVTFLSDIVIFGVITIAILLANIVFTVFAIAFMAVLAVFTFVGFTLAAIVDFLFCIFHKISSQCPECQHKTMLPSYECPKCGAIHTSLRPSKYGILKRKCQCGKKLPTTFFNGRQRLQAICPVCSNGLKDGGAHVDISIPVVGGPSSGKTCLITMAISKIQKMAPSQGLDFNYSPTNGDDFHVNSHSMQLGYVPDKTADTKMRYYQFHLTPKGVKNKNLVSICDVAGETYSDSLEIGKQIGYKNASAFLVVIDPLSIKSYVEELHGKVNTGRYMASAMPIDEVLNILINTLDNLVHGVSAKEHFAQDVAVVFTKCDIPGLSEEIGTPAVAKYMRYNGVSRFEAQNQVCRAFLEKHGESNFINTIYSKFKSVQFFTASSLGHVADGTAFSPNGVEEPVLWLIDKASKTVDLSALWGKKI